MQDINEKLLKPYDPKETEGRIYKTWEDSGFFNSDVCIEKGITKADAEPFTIIMPPTNANGSLHAGHGLVMTIEDIMTRYKRMRGYKTLWLPGLDHAGFETQIVYEKKLEKEGKSRFDFEREQLYADIMEFTLASSSHIKSQVRKMGASCDWSREKFTLDESVVKIVYQTFKKLFDDGLAYRGKRIVSWCSKHQTAFSDLEIKDVEKVEPYYYIKYGPFTISTSRPETKFGDKYVVMHPDDARYAQYTEGQKIELEWINGPITATVIKDEASDMAFGTGVMTITPWHDAVDFDIAKRHNLDKEQVIDDNGKLLSIAGEFAGLHIKKARPLIIEKLKAKGLLEKVDENYKHVLRVCYKCDTIIEPQIKDQWFINMKPLAAKAMEVIETDQITYIPEHYKKITTYWLNNIIDWNISRQIVWGIPIPAKICTKCDYGLVDLEDKETVCPKCKGTLRKDTDTFDTWFSSGQWPYAVLNYPDGKDFANYYPTDVMETAGEIIFFWVTRMIMLGLYVTGKIPFKTVYLHGLVLDAKGLKMSKSKGNVIDPMVLTEKFGTDALRIGFVVGNTPGTSLALAEDKIKAYKHFANKIWNIARFVASNKESHDVAKPAPSARDTEIMKEFNELISDVTKDMDAYRFYLGAEKIYAYVWHTFADKIIEESKEILAGDAPADAGVRESRRILLLNILETSLKLLHPFMPFVTEELWGILEPREHMLMVEQWPTSL